MCGWLSRATTLISRRNRSGPTDSANPGWSTLSATTRSCFVSWARHTIAIPPRPSSRSIVYVGASSSRMRLMGSAKQSPAVLTLQLETAAEWGQAYARFELHLCLGRGGVSSSATTRLHAANPSAHERLALARGHPAGFLLRETSPARTPRLALYSSITACAVGVLW